MNQDRINALMASDVLADVLEADRQSLAVEILHRAGLDSDGVAARPIREVAEELRKSEPWWFRQTQKEATTGTWKGITAMSVAARANIEAQKRFDLDAIEAGPNPWLPASFNLSRQGALANHRPDVAARLQVEATR